MISEPPLGGSCASGLRISVVMPAHNEEGFLATAVGEITAGLDAAGDFELIIVENGSTDNTVAIAERLAAQTSGVRSISSAGADYGLALRTGLLAARGEFVVIFDVDYFDLGFLAAALAEMTGPAQPAIVVGTKRGPGALDGRAWSRKVVTRLFSAVLRIGFGLRVSDTHGMKVLRRETVLPLVERSRFGTDLFDTELVLNAERSGLVVTEIGVVVDERRPSRSSILQRIPRTLLGLARLRVALWRDKPPPEGAP